MANLTEDELNEIRLKELLHGWKALTEREALILQMTDHTGGCPSCG